MFNNYLFDKHLMKACLAAVFAMGLAACGSSSSDTAAPAEPEPTPEEMAEMACTDGGGQWADGMCTTAEELAEMACTDGGGQWADGMCTTAEQLELAALRQQIAALRAQLGLDAEGDIGGSVSDLMAERDRLQKQISDAEDAEETRMTAEMAATAAKLYAGISAQMGDGTGISDRHAAYSGTNDSQVSVTFGDGTTAGTAIVLSADKKTMAADNRGWKGMRYADPAGGDMVEAMVYSDVEAPKMGKKFGGAAANDEFEYALTNGMITVDTTSGAGVPARVALTGVTRTAGTETFHLPDPNPQGATMINVPGSFHGVSGMYSCTPTTAADGCTASVAAQGFTLGAGAWTFKPGNPNARVLSAMDTMYASYGWWIHKTENGSTFTASAFFDYKGGDGSAELASGLDTLQGSATYMGGAAGKYALSSSTGGTNDAGHFTAKAMLEADFTDNMISGTIDNFMGADGMARNWSVELKDQAVSATGVIAGDGTTGNTDRQMTMWTIGGMDGDASGEWTGQLYNNGEDLVPMTAAGTFYTEFGQGNRMVGAFGANLQ